MASGRQKQGAEHSVSFQQLRAGAIHISGPAGSAWNLQAQDPGSVQIDVTRDPVCRIALSHLMDIEVLESGFTEGLSLSREIVHRLENSLNRIKRVCTGLRECDVDPVHFFLMIERVDQKIRLSGRPRIKGGREAQLLVHDNLSAGIAPHGKQELGGSPLSCRRLILHTPQI